MDKDQFLGALTQTGFQGVYQGNVLVAFKDIQYYPAPSIVVQSGQIVAIDDRSAPTINTLNNPGGTLDLAGKITFREDGTPSAVAWAEGDVLQGTKRTALKNVLFYPNKNIMAGALEATTPVSFFGNTEPLRAGSQLAFYPSGALKAIVTNESLDFKFMGSFTVPPGGQLTLTEQGSIRQAELANFTFSYQGKYVVGTATTVFGDHGQVTATTLGKKTQLKMADGTTRKLRAGTALILQDGAQEAINGIYNLDDASGHFIRIDTQGKSVGFRYCETLHPDHCEQIGNKSLYTRKALRQHLKLNLRDSLFTRYGENLAGVAGGMAVGIIGAGAVGGAVYFGIASATAGVDVVLGSIIGVVYGGVVLGAPAAMGAIIGVGIPVMGAVGLADLPVFQKRRAITDIVKRHVLTTDQSIDGIRSQMDAALATIL